MVIISMVLPATHLKAGHMIMALTIEVSYKYCPQS